MGGEEGTVNPAEMTECEELLTENVDLEPVARQDVYFVSPICSSKAFRAWSRYRFWSR